MHNGVFDTLEQVVEFYNSRQVADAEVPAGAGDPDAGNFGLSANQKNDLVAFIKTFTGRSPCIKH